MSVKHLYQPIIDAVRKRLAGWKAKLLSFGGRLTLTKSVISAIPLHYMQTTRIPKGVIQQLDRFRRNFLWKGNEECKSINCLVNWERVCALRSNGGMGIINLAAQNEALLLKWLWKLESEPQGHWAMTINRLYGIQSVAHLSTVQIDSFFIRSLQDLIPLFVISAVRASDGSLSWRWTASGTFTTASAYHIMQDRGLVCPFYKRLWKIKAPNKVRVFLWVAIQNKILTQQVLVGRGCHVAYGCKLCGNDSQETRDHIFLMCPYAEAFWRRLCTNVPILNPVGNNTTMVKFWMANRRPGDKEACASWDTTWAAGVWALWRERNKRTFQGEEKSVIRLAAETHQHIQQWLMVI